MKYPYPPIHDPSLDHYIVNFNGHIGGPRDIAISPLDRGLLFGDSIYEVTRTYTGIPGHFPEHYERLVYSGKGLDLVFPFSFEQICDETKNTLQALYAKLGKRAEAYIRIIVTRGIGEIGLDPKLSRGPNLLIIAKEFKGLDPEVYQNGVTLYLADTERNSKRSTDPNIKSGNYINNMRAYMEAKKAGAYEALMLNGRGEVTEGTTSNVWLVKEGKVITPPIDAGLLSGITRAKIIALALRHHIPVAEEKLVSNDFNKATECFITSSTRELVSVNKIIFPSQTIVMPQCPGAMTSKLLHLYQQDLKQSLQAPLPFFT